MLTSETKAIGFSFLTSGPTFGVEIPSQFPSVPELESPILSGVGARSFVFTPNPHGQQLAEALASEGELLTTMLDRDSRSVALYRRLLLPLTWWLRWELTGGILTTHLREEDGIDRARTVVDNLSVDEGGPTPFLLLFAPLKRSADSFPGYQEFASVWTANQEVILTFLRPAFLSPGQTMSNKDVGKFHLRAGTPHGMEVQVSADASADAETTLSSVLSTLVEGSTVP